MDKQPEAGQVGRFIESPEFRAEHFIPAHRRSPQPHDAVAALLVHEDGRYIMQLRDGKEGIFYPGHWGCFGGAIEQGEGPVNALRRELREELELDVTQARQFTKFDFDFSHVDYGAVTRFYFEVPVTDSAFRRCVLHEGADMQAFHGDELLLTRRVTPYDAFAIWMHMNQSCGTPEHPACA